MNNIKCPLCGSENIKLEENINSFARVKYEGGKSKRIFLSDVENYYCFDCKNKWSVKK
jgi:predicted nucleic-acid-binding Zn-ribbon protein